MKRFGLILLALATLFSCDQLKGMMGEDDPNSPDKGKVTFPDGSSLKLDENGQGMLRISATHAWISNIDWQGVNEEWLKMEPTSADKGGDFDIHFSAISQAEPGHTRGAEIVFRISDHKFRANVFQDGGQASIYISSVSLSHTGTLNLKVGAQQEVTVSYLPENATVVDLRWDKPDGTATFDIITNNPLRATIAAKVPGKATVTVAAKSASGNYDGPKATLDVEVTE